MKKIECDICAAYADIERQFRTLAVAYEMRAEEKQSLFLSTVGDLCSSIVREDGLLDILADYAHHDADPQEQVEALVHIMVMTTIALQERLMGGTAYLNDPENMRGFYQAVFTTFESYRVAILEANALNRETDVPEGETVH